MDRIQYELTKENKRWRRRDALSKILDLNKELVKEVQKLKQ